MAHILCVDDDTGILTVLQKVLEKGGLTVTTQSNPAKALAMTADNDYDLFVIDVVMPEMDGYALCRNLRGQEKTKDTPIVFLTGKNEIGDMLQGYNQGAHIYLGKPFNSRILLERVMELLKKYKKN